MIWLPAIWMIVVRLKFAIISSRDVTISLQILDSLERVIEAICVVRIYEGVGGLDVGLQNGLYGCFKVCVCRFCFCWDDFGVLNKLSVSRRGTSSVVVN